MAIDAAEKKELIQQYQIHQQDTGSPEAQVAILTARIQQLTEHFQTHRKDYHSRHGLYRLVGKQRPPVTVPLQKRRYALLPFN